MTSSSKFEFEKRISKLSEENDNLHDDVHVLRSALDSHHAGRGSVRSMLQKEIGGSVWEHGHAGKIHNYRSPEEKSYKRADTKSRASKDAHQASLSRDTPIHLKSRATTEPTGKKNRQEAKVPAEQPSLESLGPSASKITSHRAEARPRPSSAFTSDRRKTTKTKSPSARRDTVSAKEPCVVVHSYDEDHSLTGVDGPSVKLNETYTKESLSQVVSQLQPPVGKPSTGVTSTYSKDPANHIPGSQKRAKVLKKMIRKLDVDMKLGEYRTSETDSDSLSTPRHRDTISLTLGPQSPRFCDPDVMAWLLNQNLKDTEKYARIFADHEVDMDSLVLMTEAQLREMGVCAMGALSKLVSAIDQLRSSLKTKSRNQKPSAHVHSESGMASQRVESAGCNHRVKAATHRPHSLMPGEDRPYKPNPKATGTDQVSSKNGAECGSLATHGPAKGASMPSSRAKTCREGVRQDTGKKGAHRTRPQSSVGPTSTTQSTARHRPQSGVGPTSTSQSTAKHRPQSAAAGAHRTNGVKSSDHHKSSQDPDDSPDEYCTTKEVNYSRRHKETALSGLVSVRSLGANKANGARSPGEGTDVDGQSSKTVEAESRLQDVEAQIQELQRELTSPTAMQIISRLQNQIKEIQKEIVTSKASNNQKRHSSGTEPGSTNVTESPSSDKATGRRSMPRGSPAAPGDRNQSGEVEVVRPTPLLSQAGPVPQALVTPGLSKTVGAANTVASMSMTKTELMRNYRREKDAHRKQIRHLESELDRLKHKDPVRTCEVQEADIQYLDNDKIGEGAFSEVFRGSYQGSEVAVKRLKVPLSSQDKNYFAAEVSLLRELRHPRVVLLLGVCTGTRLPLMVLEYMALGSLYIYLHDNTRSSLDHAAYYQIAKDTALGMNYLHRHQPAVIHLDLKSMNVLLTGHLRAKIADFGFSKLRHDADQVAKKQKAQPGGHVKGTPAWMAPELLNTGDVSTKSDVYSYSIILWEMLTRKHPYEGCTVFQVIDRTRNNKRLEIPSSCPVALCDLIARCWNSNPARRPSFKDIIEFLDRLQLPEDWRTLFAKAGIPDTALENVESTRTLIGLVSLTLDKLEVPQRPSDVPSLNLVDSCDKLTRERWQFLNEDSEDEDWEDVSEDDSSDGIVYGKTPKAATNGQVFSKQEKPGDVPLLDLNLSGDQRHVKSMKTFRKSVNFQDVSREEIINADVHSANGAKTGIEETSLLPPSYIPPPPPLQAPQSLSGATPPNKKAKKVRYDVRESFLDQLQCALNDRPSFGEVGHESSENPIKPNGDTLKPSHDLDLRASQLLSQKQRLKSTEIPHPCQLTDLTEVPQETIKNLFDVLKEAVSNRRMHILQGDSLDKSLTQRTWSEDSI